MKGPLGIIFLKEYIKAIQTDLEMTLSHSLLQTGKLRSIEFDSNGIGHSRGTVTHWVLCTWQMPS